MWFGVSPAVDIGCADPWVLELAKKHGMNTDVRKNVFCILMTSEVSCVCGGGVVFRAQGMGVWHIGMWGVACVCNVNVQLSEQ